MKAVKSGKKYNAAIICGIAGLLSSFAGVGMLLAAAGLAFSICYLLSKKGRRNTQLVGLVTSVVGILISGVVLTQGTVPEAVGGAPGTEAVSEGTPGLDSGFLQASGEEPTAGLTGGASENSFGTAEGGGSPGTAGTVESGSGPETAGQQKAGQASGWENGQDANGSAGGSDGAMQELAVHFLDVGQGDATLIVCGEEAMLIDAGDNGQGTFVQNYLQKQGVESLKYAVCTHPDEDHIGGMDVILYKFDCGTVLMTEEEKDTNTYRDVVDTMEDRGYRRTAPMTGQQYALGDAIFTILGPDSLGSDSNNNSIVILLTHGENTFLFTGDAEEAEEEAIAEGAISPAADVYKAGHHGSRTSSSKKLLDAVSPAYAVISCGEGNSYGHPHAETLNNLRAMGVQVFRTDEQGSIIATSDGREISWNCSPSQTWQAGEPTGSSGNSARPSGQESAAAAGGSEAASSEAGSGTGTPSESEPAISEPATSPEAVSADYICNLNTKKFHYPDCSSVKKMKESNKLPVNGTRDEIISQGYEPCKICNP